MTEDKLTSKESNMTRINFAGLEQMQQLSKSITETSRSLELISKTVTQSFSSDMIKQFSSIQETVKHLRENLGPTIQTMSRFAEQQKLIAESLKPMLKLGEIYSAQLNALASIAKINFPLFTLSDLVRKRREFVHQKLEKELKIWDEEYYKMWNGSWIALDSNNPDKIRQSANSMREFFRTLIHKYSDDKLIMEKYSIKKRGDITRRHRLEFIFSNKGIAKEKIEQLNNTISFALGIDDEIQKTAHIGGEEEKFRNLLYLYEGFIWLIIGLDYSFTN